MSEAKIFKCPSCGSALSPQGTATQIKCPYCGNTVSVPEEMRAPTPHAVIVQTELPASAASSSSGVWVAVGGIAVLLIIVAVVVFALLPGSNPASSLSLPVATPTPAGFAHVVLTFGGEGTAPGLFQDARHVGIDSTGNMYVDEYKSLRVQKFDPSGKYVSSWNVDGKLCSNKTVSPDRIETDRNGNVYIQFCGSVLKYDGATGKLLDQFKGDNNSPRDFYLDIASYPEGGLLVTSDAAPVADEAYLKLDYNGKVATRWTNLVTDQSNDSVSAGTLQPVADGLGNLFILSTSDSAVYKFTRDGKFVTKFGSVGKGVGQFDAVATHIALDNQSRVYVTDFAGIKVFDSNGAFLDSMSDRIINGGIDEFKITDQNDIYVVGNQNMIYKLALNADWHPGK